MDRCPYELDPTGSDLPGEAAQLNGRGPATRVVLPGAVDAWLVTDPELLRALFTDPRVSKDARRNWPALDSMSPEWPLYQSVTVRNMFTADGAEHRRLRTLVTPALGTRRILDLRPQIEQITAGLLDDLATTEPGVEVDLRESFAYPLPLEVITSLFGITDPRLRDDFRRAVTALFATAISPEESVAAIERNHRVLSEVIEQKRRCPGDDMTSALLNLKDEDDSRLSEAELVDTLGLVVGAAHDTTVNLIDHAMTALLMRPWLRERVTAGEVSWTAVIEETLRWQPPIPNLPMRFATEDIELPGGATISPGEPIMAGLLAANRHPDYQADADEFDPGRQPAAHLAFGHGPHYCPGASLARLEAEVALPAIFARFPEITATAEPVPAGDSFLSNGHFALPAVLRP